MRKEERERNKYTFVGLTGIPAKALSMLLVCVLLAAPIHMYVSAQEDSSEKEISKDDSSKEGSLKEAPSKKALPESEDEDEENSEETDGMGDIKKEEAVYCSVSPCGEVKSLYVVNSFAMPYDGVMQDHGNYSEVENLTDLTPLKDEDGIVSAEVKKGLFYYQGELKKKEFPWLIDISYTLNGSERDSEMIGGASGKVGITIRTSGNPEVDPVYYERYVLVVSVTLDTNVCDHIRAKGAMVTSTGSDKMFNFISMPEKESEFNIKFRTKNFSMKGITFAAMPATMDKDMFDFEQISEMTDGLTKLAEGVETLSGGADSLNEGMQEFTGGANSLDDGLTSLHSGIEQLSDGAGQLSDGAAQLKDGSSQFKDGLNQLNEGSDALAAGSAQINEVFQGLKKMADMLGGVDMSALVKLKDELSTLKGSMGEATKKFIDMTGKIRESLKFTGFKLIPETESALALAEITKLAAEGKISRSTLNVYKMLMGNYLIAASADMFLNSGGKLQEWTDQFLDGLDERIGTLGDVQTIQPDALLDISGMIDTFADQFQTFHNGIVSYTGGVKALAENYEEIDKGIQGLSEGTAGISGGLKKTEGGTLQMLEGVHGFAGGAGQLAGGMSELASGIRQLNEQTADMPDKVQKGIDDMLGKFSDPDFKPPSFVSAKNGRIEAVQFVASTEEIEGIKEDTPKAEKPVKKGFFEKLTDLFKPKKK